MNVPDDLLHALAEHPDARQVFEGLAVSHRREYLEWIDEAKRAETRARRIEQTIKRLTADK